MKYRIKLKKFSPIVYIVNEKGDWEFSEYPENTIFVVSFEGFVVALGDDCSKFKTERGRFLIPNDRFSIECSVDDEFKINTIVEGVDLSFKGVIKKIDTDHVIVEDCVGDLFKVKYEQLEMILD